MNTTYNDELAVRKLHDEVLHAFNQLNLQKLLSLHTDNIILMEPNMPLISGKQEIVQLFEKFKNQRLRLNLSYTVHEVEVFGDRAFVRGQVVKTTFQNNEAPVNDIGKFITLSQKQNDGTWLRTHVIVNSDAPPEEKSSSPKPILMGMNNRLWNN